MLVNDLYTLVAAHREEYLKEDRLHLSEEGIRACGEQVCAHIRRAAATLAETGERETVSHTTIVW